LISPGFLVTNACQGTTAQFKELTKSMNLQASAPIKLQMILEMKLKLDLSGFLGNTRKKISPPFVRSLM
jgi:hypothetical protein